MSTAVLKEKFSDPVFLFIAGWCAVMLALAVSVGRPWVTFIHFWRVDFVASVFLSASLVYLLMRYKNGILRDLSGSEIRWIIVPMLVLIAWSSLSISWSSSWKSAVHHTAIWCSYLIFFLFVRSVVKTRNGVRASLTMLVACLAFASIPALFGYIAYQIFGGALNTGILFQKSGEQVTALLPLTLLTVVNLEGRKLTFGVAGLALLWILVLSGLGRLNLILFVAGFAVTILLTLIFWRSKKAVRHRIVLIALIFAVIPAVLVATARLSGPETATVASRISGDEGTQSSNSFRKLMMSMSWEMIASSPWIGIGADNFGFRLNEFRAAYGRGSPDDPNIALAESEIPERAHNELLQITAELGIVGGAVAAWLVLGVAFMAVRAVKRRLLSPFRIAALVGAFVFLASSLISSYSFRLIQNGFVFFFLLAICSSYFSRRRDENEEASRLSELLGSRVALVAALAACLVLLTYSSIRVASVIATTIGNETVDTSEAERYYSLAMKLDDENPDAPNSLGMRRFNAKQFYEAARLLSRSVAIGKATSTDLSYLASAYALAGDQLAAERTMEHAAEMYPRSVFVLVRYAILAKTNGKTDASAKALERAQAIDPRAANTWVELISNGPLSASEAAFRDNSSFVPVMDLKPNPAIYAVLDERELSNPGERRKVGE